MELNRSRTPYMVNPLIAGFDTETGKVCHQLLVKKFEMVLKDKCKSDFKCYVTQPELYFMDYLAAMIQTK